MHGISCRSMHFTFLVGTFNGDVEYRMQDKVIFEPYSTRFRKIRITSLRMLKRYSLKHYATAWVINILLGYFNAAAGAQYDYNNTSYETTQEKRGSSVSMKWYGSFSCEYQQHPWCRNSSRILKTKRKC